MRNFSDFSVDKQRRIVVTIDFGCIASLLAVGLLSGTVYEVGHHPMAYGRFKSLTPSFGRKMLKAVLLSAFAGFFVPAQLASGDTAARSLLDRAIAHENLLERSFSKLVISCVTRAGAAKTAFNGPVDRLRMSSDGHRFIIDAKETSRTVGAIFPGATRRELILTNDGRQAIYIPETGGLLVLGNPHSTPTAVAAMIADPTWGGFLDGYVPLGNADGASVLDLASKSEHLSISASPESVGGVKAYLVTSEGGGWTTRLWIAPQDDYCVVKASISGNAVGEQMETTVDNVQLGNVGPVDFVWAAHYHGRFDPADPAEPESEMDGTARRVNLELNPPFNPSDFSLASVKNGTLVEFMGQPPSGILYVWKDGNAVPNADPSIVQGIQQEVNQLRPPNGPIAYTQTGDATDWRATLFMMVLGIAASALAMALGATMIFLRSKQRTRS